MRGYEFEFYYDNYIVNANGRFYQSTNYRKITVYLLEDELLSPYNLNPYQLGLQYRTRADLPKLEQVIAGAVNYTETYNIELSIYQLFDNDLPYKYTAVGCPEGTLDCDGCCIDCAEVNNGILNILSIVNSIGNSYEWY